MYVELHVYVSTWSVNQYTKLGFHFCHTHMGYAHMKCIQRVPCIHMCATLNVQSRGADITLAAVS